MSNSTKAFQRPSFDPDTNQIDFGGVHLYYYGPDSMAFDAGMGEGLIAGFINRRPENELAYAQRVTGGELAPGGSGYQLNKPEGGYSERDLKAIGDFVEKMGTVVENIQKQVAQKTARVTQLG
jgi:hypothetical protein